MLKHKLIDALIILLIIVVGILFFRLVSGSKAMESKLEAQRIQASVLVNEIGQTKEENQMIFEKLVEAQKQVDELREEYGWISAIQEDLVTVENAQKVMMPDTLNFLIVGHNDRLADTILVAAVNVKEQRVSLISLPRDFC